MPEPSWSVWRHYSAVFSAALIASFVTIVTRLYIGGAGALAGCVSIVIAAFIALIYARMSGNRRDLRGLMLLGLLMSVNFVSVVLLPGGGLSWEVLGSIPVLAARNMLGMVIIGHLLAIEDNRQEEYERVKQESERDPLTGLANRRVLDLVADQHRRQRETSVFSVILFDIDRFKRINDTYGHDFGDRVLSRVSALISGRMRGGDVVVRYGGEEICVVVADSRGYNTVRVAEDIRLQVSGERFVQNGDVVNVTVSAGVAQSDENASTVYQVLKHADEALYEAKKAGRNRVSLYAPQKQIQEE